MQNVQTEAGKREIFHFKDVFLPTSTFKKMPFNFW